MKTTKHRGLSPLLDVHDLASFLKKSVATIRSDISRAPENLPPSIKVGGQRRWMPETVVAWCREREETPHVRRKPGRPRKQPTRSPN